MTVAELLDRIDSKEISEWIAFYNIEPFGEERADLRSAIIASTMANMWRGKGQRAFTAKDFMPQFDPRPKQSIETMKAILQGLANRGNNSNVKS